MRRVQVIGPVRLRVLKVGDDGETPVALAQREVATDRVAERAGTVKAPESLLDLRYLCGSCPAFSLTRTTFRITTTS